MLVHGGYNTE
jgi:hypothetical protein